MHTHKLTYSRLDCVKEDWIKDNESKNDWRPQSDCHLTSTAIDQDQKYMADVSDVITQRAFQLSESSSGENEMVPTDLI